MSRLALPSVALALSVACTGRGEVWRPPVVGDTDTDDVPHTGETGFTGVDGFIIRGVANDLETAAPVADGLCVYAVDPTPVLLGGDPDVLATNTIKADGRFWLVGVVTDSSIGILVLVDDCEGAAEDTVVPTASGIAVEDYQDLGDGDLLQPDRTAWSITNTHATTIDAGFAAAGETKVLSGGALLGTVRVQGAETPIDGAIVTCASDGCTPPAVYYADTDTSDGLFTTGTTPNSATIAAARSLYFIPGAPIITYKADDGGAHTFTSRLAGSFPGWSVFVAFEGT